MELFHLFVCVFVCLFVCLPVCLFVCPLALLKRQGESAAKY